MGTKTYDSATDLITFSRASSATFLGSNGLLQTAANNVPRIEYDATGAVKGLLIEEARTNLLTHSNDFTNAVWINTNNSNTANAGVSPDGTSNANKVVPSTNAGVHYTYRDLSFLNTDYSFSVYVASSGYGFATICAGTVGVADYYAVVIDLSDGTQTALYSQGTHSKTVTVEPVGSYYRVTISGNGEKYYVVGASDTGTYTPSSYGFKSFSGDGTSGILVYGAQIEAGAFPTSYIPTTGAAATRARDIAQIPTSAFGYNNDKGTVVCEFDSAKLNGSTVFTLDLDGAGIENGITTIVYPANRISYQAVTGGAVQANLNFDAYATASQVSKVATVYAKDDFAAVLNGGAVATDTAASLPTVDLLRLGVYLRGASFPMSGHIKSIQYYPRRLTNTQLQELTT